MFSRRSWKDNVLVKQIPEGKRANQKPPNFRNSNVRNRLIINVHVCTPVHIREWVWDRIRQSDRQSRRMSIILSFLSLRSAYVRNKWSPSNKLHPAPNADEALVLSCWDWHSNLPYITAPKQRWWEQWAHCTQRCEKINNSAITHHWPAREVTRRKTRQEKQSSRQVFLQTVSSFH